MTQQSEYMEAFFGVELSTKFSDMVNDLKEIEENLKDLSEEMGRDWAGPSTRRSSKGS